MQQIKLNKKAIKNYIMPEMENLKAMLKGFQLQKSLKVFAFLSYIIDCEISENLQFKNNKKKKLS